MESSTRSALHPLLLEPGYWRERLRELEGSRPSLMLLPRPDLSGPAVEVDEFRMRTHDGIRLSGLRARCRLRFGEQPARLCLLGPCDRLDFDEREVEEGRVVFVLQEAAGRRLVDRVLDVLRLLDVAATTEGVDPTRVELHPDSFAPGGTGREPRRSRCLPDEIRIVAQLRQARI